MLLDKLVGEDPQMKLKALYVIEACLKHNVPDMHEIFTAEMSTFEDLTTSETATVQTQSQKVIRLLSGTGSPAPTTKSRPSINRMASQPQQQHQQSLVDVDEALPVQQEQPAVSQAHNDMFADMTPVNQTADMFASMNVQSHPVQQPSHHRTPQKQQPQGDLWIDVSGAEPKPQATTTESFIDQLDPLKNPQLAQQQQPQPQPQQQQSPVARPPMQQPYMQGAPGMYPQGYAPAMYPQGYPMQYAVPMQHYPMYAMQPGMMMPYGAPLRQRTSSFGPSPEVETEKKKEEAGFDFIGKKDSFDFVADEMSRQVKTT